MPTTEETSTSGSLVVLATTRADLEPVLPLVDYLYRTEHRLVVTVRESMPPWGAPDGAEVAPTGAGQVRWPIEPLPPIVLGIDAGVRRWLLPPAASWLVSRATFRTVPTLPPGAQLHVDGTGYLIDLVLATVAKASPLDGPHLAVLPPVWTLVADRLMNEQSVISLGRALLGSARWAALAQLADLRIAGPDPHPAYLSVLGGIARLNLGEPVPQVSELVRAGLAWADNWTGDPRRAVEVTTWALRLLFHRELHTVTDHTLVVTDPDSVVDVIEASQILRPLRAQLHRGVADGSVGDGPATDSAQMVLLTGAYPNFYQDLLVELEAFGDVRVVDLGARHTAFRNTEMESATLDLALALAAGVEPTDPPWDKAEGPPWVGADVVVADWVDKAAVIASWTIAQQTRLVMRCHGADALSGWIHLVNWSRVDTLICVSTAMERIVRGLLGERLDTVNIEVIPVSVELDGLPVDKVTGSDRTLGVIGWSQRVKDVHFALDILQGLRVQDPRWRLLLIGPDYAAPANDPETIEQRAVRARLLSAPLRGAVEFTGQVDRAGLAELLPSIGIGLSTSLRESFHLGMMEMLVSGAFPVVRDWPAFAPVGGASSVYPPEVIVSDSMTAIQRILAASSDPARSAEVTAQHRAWALARYGRVTLAERLGAVVNRVSSGN
ncbi:MAG: glycosyltransferase family 4 protein [Nostocoides sp.]